MSTLPSKPRATSSKKKKKDDEEQQTRNSNRTARQTVRRRLKTGQTISLSPQDDRMIRLAYEFMAGYVKRHELQSSFDLKKSQFLAAAEAGEYSTDMDLDDYLNNSKARKQSGQDGTHRFRKKEDDEKSMVSGGSDHSAAASLDSDKEDEDMLPALAEFRHLRRDVQQAYVRLHNHLADCEKNKITLSDLEAVLKRMHVTTMSKKQMEQIIWEIDEDMDGCVSWDEFQLTFCRNVDTTSVNHASEPHVFFRIIEFLTFDEARKGYCLEDDVMEVLFSRYGSYRLEKELQYLFGSSLRALGGDGTLYLERYLTVLMERSGRRAMVSNV